MIQPFNFHLNAASADYVEHFTARDEVRKNFPLSSILPHDGGGLKQQEFIGVHSDIGGGYADDEGEHENKLVRIGRLKLRHGQRARAFDRVGTVDQDVYRIRYFYSQEEIEDLREEAERVGYTVTEERRANSIWLVGRKEVKKQLANVYLHLMHKRAVEAGVPFEPLLDDAEHKIPEDLNDYAKALLGGETTPQVDEVFIYASYVHQSDVDPEDRAPIFKIKSYFGDLANEPSEGHVRVIFGNEPQDAVDPEANDCEDAYGAEIDTENLSV